jgi:hypothetical protein
MNTNARITRSKSAAGNLENPNFGTQSSALENIPDAASAAPESSPEHTLQPDLYSNEDHLNQELETRTQTTPESEHEEPEETVQGDSPLTPLPAEFRTPYPQDIRRYIRADYRMRPYPSSTLVVPPVSEAESQSGRISKMVN